ncbi:ergothioneine biosynthesis PLP-dependent enzyme EgtE [Mycobacterium sp.]|jgi:pyridoxal 5-phosphate dependent beta-lyase|uniref:ergothioneine biosynthesis PLP-dependent enzyme EgtE n=1 Tax=Mycobacterium sp. TaxID=1785 RepID=UPI002D3FF564|nr:ergothioneine biosynthesis PLP-dependent enzyme EgtE [Mycobacterium sp.]HZA11127.1 ergothioneine biosynthesis PLP-dependent enzyme EgtE [Mycobacterium sp.]
MTTTAALAEQWRSARPAVTGVHLDSAACSRQSFAAIDAAANHARREAEAGGYVAAAEADATLAAGRAGVATLTGMTPDDVVFTTGAAHALDLLLASWPQRGGVIACLPGEFGPNLAVMAANGFAVRALPTDGLGRAVVDDVAALLAAEPPDLVHLTAVASHRGIVQPVKEVSALCAEHRVPLVVDAAQALGHVDCAVDADAVYSTSRKWLTGPRGVGVLAVRSVIAERLRPRLPPPDWPIDIAPLRRLELGEANIAARVGFSIAVGEHVATGPERVRDRLAAVGRSTRAALRDVAGWRVVEPEDTPTAITTLAPTGHADVERVRADLIAGHSIVTTVAGPDRAPFELTHPVLRVSPHVDVTDAELASFAGALNSVCAR